MLPLTAIIDLQEAVALPAQCGEALSFVLRLNE